MAMASMMLLIAIAATAQKSSEVADTTLASKYELSEVKVVASRNNATLKEIPASVSIISSKQLSQVGIQSLYGVSTNTPNLFMPEYGSKLTAPIYIRGIGSRINAPSVGLYVDNVPFFDKSTFAFDFFGIEQVEVLRGPQGTLYGRNTMGGIINIVTKSPASYQGLDLSLNAGTYGSYNVNGGYYGKASDKLAYSLAVNLLHNDGFYTNSYSQTHVDMLNSLGLRNRLIWKLSEALSVENIASFENSRQGGYPYSQYFAAKDSAAPIRYNEYSYYNRKLLSDALVVKYNGRNFEVKSTSAFQYQDDHQAIDQDFSELSTYYVNQWQKQHMISQEATIRSRDGKRVSWLFGAFGFIQLFDTQTEINTYASKTLSSKFYDHTIAGGALFHQLTINNFIVENLSITGGIRFDVERDRLTYKVKSVANGKESPLASTKYPSLESNQLIPKVALAYKWNQTNIYATVAKGYKTGGFNSSFDDVNQDLNFKPEKSINYEVGVKSPLLMGHFYGDVALFYIDWSDQQIAQSLKSGVGTKLTNAGKSTSQGVEVSLSMAPLSGFDANISYGYTRAKFDRYVVNATTDYSGKYIPFIPGNTLSVQAGKTFTVNSTWLDAVRVSAAYRGVGDIYWVEKNDAKQKFYNLLDARVSFTKKRMSVELWGKNLTDTQYNSYFFQAFGKSFVQRGRPMQLGVSVNLSLL